MCLGLPGRIVSVEDGGARGLVDVLGTIRPIDLGLLVGPVQPGQHVLIHSGVALQRLSLDQAAESGALFARKTAPDVSPGVSAEGPAPTAPA